MVQAGNRPKLGDSALRVLVACEFSGIVREAFRRRGHDAWSCDLLPAEDGSEFHITGDVSVILDHGWHLLVGHPPCTLLSNSGCGWLFNTPKNPTPGVLYEKERFDGLKEAVKFFLLLWRCPIPHICIENPRPHKWAMELIGRKFDCKIQPWEFGDKQKNGTCLWLKNLPPLMPTKFVGPPPTDKEEAKKWEDCWRMAPGKDQAKNRSRTFPGIAEAMAEQWGNL